MTDDRLKEVGQGETYLRFADLKLMGIVNNWPTLARWIEKEGFPPGIKIGNTRLWALSEVNAWLQSRRDGQQRNRNDKVGRVIARTAQNLSAEVNRMVRDLPEDVVPQEALERALEEASELQPFLAMAWQK
jgi:predicted DNA-binding transcriptional regulator AlpA